MKDQPEGKFCIYCFEDDESNINRSHLFPQCIGGRFCEFYSCKTCNSSWGTEFESKLKECFFFANGIAALNISSVEEAFSAIPIESTSTGSRVTIEKNRFRHHVKFDPSSGNIVGSKKDATRKLLEVVRKNYPNWVDHIKRILQENNSGEFSLPGGKKYRFSVEKVETSDLVFGRTINVPMELIAKLTYESLYLLRPFSAKSVRDFYVSTFRCDTSKRGKGRVLVSKSFFERVGMEDNGVAAGKAKANSVEYRPYHRIGFGITSEGSAYAKIQFFGAESFLVVIEKCTLESSVNPEALCHHYYFPIEKNEIHMIENSDVPEELKVKESHFVDRKLAEIRDIAFDQPPTGSLD